jgi:uncharacterized PurR-regulated membrane protein YhhQ (DUF165 family)
MSTDTAPTSRLIAPSLFAFGIFYGGMVCIAGVLGNKQVALGPLAVEAGIFAFLLLVVTSSAIAELHGRADRQQAGAVGLRAAAGLGGADGAGAGASRIRQDGAGPPVLVRVDHGIEPADLACRADRLRHQPGAERHHLLRAQGPRGQPLALRPLGVASALSQIVDTLIFITVAFYGVFPIGALLAGQMLSKVVLSIVFVPPLIILFVKLGRSMDSRSA